MTNTPEKNPTLSKLRMSKYLYLLPYFRDQRIQQYLTVILSLIAILLSLILAVNNTLPTITQLKKELMDLQEVKQKIETKIDNLIVLQRKYDNVKTEIAFLDTMLPDLPKVPPLQGQLQEIARTTNVSLSDLQTGEVNLLPNGKPAQTNGNTTSQDTKTEKTNAKNYSFTVSVTGPYANLVNFLTTLTAFDRLTTIDTISIEPNQSKTQPWTAVVSGQTYFMPSK